MFITRKKYDSILTEKSMVENKLIDIEKKLKAQIDLTYFQDKYIEDATELINSNRRLFDEIIFLKDDLSSQKSLTEEWREEALYKSKKLTGYIKMFRMKSSEVKKLHDQIKSLKDDLNNLNELINSDSIEFKKGFFLKSQEVIKLKKEIEELSNTATK